MFDARDCGSCQVVELQMSKEARNKIFFFLQNLEMNHWGNTLMGLSHHRKTKKELSLLVTLPPI